MTAAAIAPKPTNDTGVGQRYCRTNGKTYLSSPAGKANSVALVYPVAFQSEKVFMILCTIDFSSIDIQKETTCLDHRI